MQYHFEEVIRDVKTYAKQVEKIHKLKNKIQKNINKKAAIKEEYIQFFWKNENLDKNGNKYKIGFHGGIIRNLLLTF